MTLGLTALAPFAGPPRLSLGYTLGGGGGATVSESLVLPAVRLQTLNRTGLVVLDWQE